MTNKAVLLVNLGSPDTPETKSVRRYLNQFLMDPYVIQLPWVLRRLIVSLFVLPRRPQLSAQAYKSIWLSEGSPLIVISKRLQQALQQKVACPVTLAMRYGNPNIEHAILQLAENTKISEILLLPLYPHYALSTVTTSIEEARRVIQKHHLTMKLTVMDPFYDRTEYIHALISSAQEYIDQDFDHIIFSYHGLPESHITKQDKSGQHCLKKADCCYIAHPSHQTCYRYQVIRTTECFTTIAGIPKNKFSIAFQSRLGRSKWLGPNTEDKIRQLATSGYKNILVICPAFVTDCLETLEEIAIRGQEIFQQAGGEKLTLIPCLNDNPKWINVLASWIEAYTRPSNG